MKYKTMQYEIIVQACTFLSPLQPMQSRLHRFLQLFCLFECGNAQNTTNMNGRCYAPENKKYVRIPKETQRTVYKIGRNMNLCASPSIVVNMYFFTLPKIYYKPQNIKKLHGHS